jgi:hypothetical protein
MSRVYEVIRGDEKVVSNDDEKQVCNAFWPECHIYVNNFLPRSYHSATLFFIWFFIMFSPRRISSVLLGSTGSTQRTCLVWSTLFCSTYQCSCRTPWRERRTLIGQSYQMHSLHLKTLNNSMDSQSNSNCSRDSVDMALELRNFTNGIKVAKQFCNMKSSRVHLAEGILDCSTFKSCEIMPPSL